MFSLCQSRPRLARIPARFAGLARLVAQQQTVDARLHKAALRTPHARFGDAGAAHDLCRAAAVGGGQQHPGSPHMLRGTIATGNDRLKPLPIARSEPDFDVTAYLPIVTRNLDHRNLMFRSMH